MGMVRTSINGTMKPKLRRASFVFDVGMVIFVSTRDSKYPIDAEIYDERGNWFTSWQMTGRQVINKTMAIRLLTEALIKHKRKEDKT